MRTKETCIKKRDWFRLNLANIRKMWKQAFNQWEWRRHAFKNGCGSGWVGPILGRCGNRLATNENEGEMH
jgi:hypothetical protein